MDISANNNVAFLYKDTTASLEHLLEKVSWAMDGISRSREGVSSPRYQELDQVFRGLLAMKEEWEAWRQ